MFLKEIKQKISSTQRISQVTKALELVSAVKMKKAQKLALCSRPFAIVAIRALKRLSAYQKRYLERESFYFRQRKVKKILVVVVSSDKGFCGSFNQNILKFAEKEIGKLKGDGKVEIMTVGKKAVRFFKRKGYDVKIEFTGIGDYGKLVEVSPIARLFLRYFKKNEYQKIYLFYTHFYSTFLQKPKMVQLLPSVPEAFEELLEERAGKMDDDKKIDYILEPSVTAVFDNLIPQLIEFEVHQTVLEANASEHSARMMAMKNASQNAADIIQELTLDYNKVRQNQITSEISEISSAKEVMG